jgi:DNA-binding GntR family transcriptional regulator
LLDILINISNIKLKKSNQEIKAINLNQKDAASFKSIAGLPALSNTWKFYDVNDNLVLIDEEIIINSLKVKNYYY